jgi:hypothetical protein
MYRADSHKRTPLFVHACRILLGSFIIVSLSGCVTTGSYGSKKSEPRQYIRAPDGWGGKYCLQNPTEC